MLIKKIKPEVPKNINMMLGAITSLQ